MPFCLSALQAEGGAVGAAAAMLRLLGVMCVAEKREKEKESNNRKLLL